MNQKKDKKECKCVPHGKCFYCVLQELLKNPEFKKEYERFDLAWELEKLWIRVKIWWQNL